MADVSRRRQELRPLKRGALLSLLTWLLLASPVTAQDSGRLMMGADLSIAHLYGEWTPQIGGVVALRLAPWIDVGGAARVDLEHPTVEEQGDVRIRFGYGGVRVAVRPALERWPGLTVSLLGGAGNVDVHEPSFGGVVSSENGGIVEPGVSFTQALASRLGVSASASWRFAFEFDAEVGVDPAEIGGPALGIGFTLGPF